MLGIGIVIEWVENILYMREKNVLVLFNCFSFLIVEIIEGIYFECF